MGLIEEKKKENRLHTLSGISIMHIQYVNMYFKGQLIYGKFMKKPMLMLLMGLVYTLWTNKRIGELKGREQTESRRELIYMI